MGVISRNHASGFSIIEVLIIVAIAAILTGIAIPAFNLFIGNTRTSTLANEFVSALNLARSEAIKRGENVSVCRSADGATCLAGGPWGQGWMVYHQNGGSIVPIRVRNGLGDASSFVGKGVFADDNTIVTFRNDGIVNGSINEADDYFEVGNMGKVLCIKINQTGRVRAVKPPC